MHFIRVCYFDGEKMKAAYQHRFKTFIELPVESLDFICTA